MARNIAKHVVWNNYAKECLVSISYAIGKADPVSFSIDTQGTGSVDDEILTLAALEVFNLRPAAIIEHLRLRNARYAETANYGHFKSGLYPWEMTLRQGDFRATVDRLCQEAKGGSPS